MPIPPNDLPIWATNDNYDDGPAAGTPTKVATTVDQQENGFDPGQEPGAQQLGFWMNLVYQWLLYMSGLPIAKRWRWFAPLQNNETVGPWFEAHTASDATHAYTVIDNTGGSFIVPIDVEVGLTIYDIGFAVAAYGESVKLELQHNVGASGTVWTVASFIIGPFVLPPAGLAKASVYGGGGQAITPVVVLDGGAYWLKVTGTNNGFTFGGDYSAKITAVGVQAGTAVA